MIIHNDFVDLCFLVLRYHLDWVLNYRWRHKDIRRSFWPHTVAALAYFQPKTRIWFWAVFGPAVPVASFLFVMLHWLRIDNWQRFYKTMYINGCSFIIIHSWKIGIWWMQTGVQMGLFIWPTHGADFNSVEDVGMR